MSKKEIFSHNLELPLVIPAGEKFQAEVQIDESQLREGEFRKVMRIMTNDQQNMRVFIRIMGNTEQSSFPSSKLYLENMLMTNFISYLEFIITTF